MPSEALSRNKFNTFFDNLELSENKRSYNCMIYISSFIKFQKMGTGMLVFRWLHVILTNIGYGFQRKTTFTTVFRVKYSKCNVYSKYDYMLCIDEYI